jgi:hypothetical protein
MRRLARLLAVLVVAYVFWRPEVAHACVCHSMDPETQFTIQEAVFLGRVERVDASSIVTTELTLAVRRVWKGDVPPTADATFQLTMCGPRPDFAHGKSYFVYSTEYRGTYFLAGCNRLVPVGIGAWHDMLLLTAWDLRIVGPVLIGLQLLLRWQERRAARVAAGGA